MKLDTLRGDLGIPAFPPKDFQDRFLSRLRPTYYLRTRQYSRTKAEPPFVVNYQGCLFRQYPGEYQTLLDIGDGNFRRVEVSGSGKQQQHTTCPVFVVSNLSSSLRRSGASLRPQSSSFRPGLGEFKQQLVKVRMGKNQSSFISAVIPT